MQDTERLRYSRHILLNEIRHRRAAALASARALVVGAGGLGSPLAMYLACGGLATSRWSTMTRWT